MGFPRAQVNQWLAASARATGKAPPVKARKKPGTGDWATRKAWWAEMARGPGLFMAIKTVTEKNTGGHWRAKDKRASYQRTLADTEVWNYIRVHKLKLPVKVTLKRYGPQILDEGDNDRSAVAHIRDGIADALGTDDSATGGITWVYAEQVKTGRGQYGVRVEIEQLNPHPKGKV